MAKSAKPRKKYNPNKTLTRTPATIRYSKDEGENLKLRIYQHLKNFKDRNAVVGDYQAIMFRVKVGLGLADLFEQTEIKSVFTETLTLLANVKERRIRTEKWMMGDNEIEQVRKALVLVDETQDKSTRKEQIPVFIKAQAELDMTLFDTLK